MRALLATLAASLLATSAIAQQANAVFRLTQDPTEIGPIADMGGQPTTEELAARAEVRDYRQQIREIRHKYFDNKRRAAVRAEGITRMTEFTDPAAFVPLIEELSDEDDDVRTALLEHFEDQGEWGQAALAWIAINEYQSDPGLHYESIKRLTTPASPPVMNIIEQGLRSGDDFVANLSGRLAGHLDIYDTIPLLIHGQSGARVQRVMGDDAWILVGTQRVFIRALIPIIGDNSGAFLPVPGVLTEGVVMRIVEAVAVIYRTEVHRVLVAMTSNDWGRSTAHMGYDKDQWITWYNDEYLPYKTEQALIEELASRDHDKTDPPGRGGG